MLKEITENKKHQDELKQKEHKKHFMKVEYHV